MLTTTKRLYAQARVDGLNIKDSAIAAGCPEKTARQAGSRLEKDRDVKSAMVRILDASPGEAGVAIASLPSAPVAKKKPAPKKPAASMPVTESADIPAENPTKDPLAFMEKMMNDRSEEPRLRLDAAKALASFRIPKPGDKGKKEQKQEDAQKTVGRFGLRSVGNV